MNNQRPSFLDFLVEASPQIEPPPFFAARVSSLVERKLDLASSLAILARRLAPVLMTLSMVVCAFSYFVATQEIEEQITYADMFAEQESVDSQVTFEEVLASLALPE